MRATNIDPDIDIGYETNRSNGTTDQIYFKPRDKNSVWSVDGFIQHYFRGNPTHKTSFSGAVAAGAMPRHFVGFIDSQYTVTFSRKKRYDLTDLNLRGGKDLTEVKGLIKAGATVEYIDTIGTVYFYRGNRKVFIIISDSTEMSGSKTYGIMYDGQNVIEVISGSKAPPGKFDLRFAEYCA